jgi:hypothetical protein
LVFGVLALLAACTGSDPVTDGSGGNEAGADAPSNLPPPPPPPGQDGDAAVTCDAGLTGCGSACADLGTSPDNCAKCGHSCGGGKCTAGVCQPATLYQAPDGGPNIGPIAVSPTEVLFATTTDMKLSACPKSGCTLMPRQIVTMSYQINSVALPSTGTVFFESAPTQATERPAMYFCDVAGCPGALPAPAASDGLNGFQLRTPVVGNRVFFTSGGFGLGWSDCTPNGASCTPAQYAGANAKGTRGMSADATNFYFIDSISRGQGVAKCAQDDTACTPTVLVAGPGPAMPMSDLIQTAVGGNILYWIKQGRSSFVEGKILLCDLTAACPTPSTALAVGLDSPTEILVDADGVYWITMGSSAAPQARIQRCALPNCTGGAQEMAKVEAGSHGLATDDKFIYWAQSTAVLRVAK